MPRWMVWITWSAALLIGPVAWALGPPIASASSPHLTVVSVDATHSTSPALSAATTPRAPATVPVMSPPCALAWDPLPPHPDGRPWPDLAYHVYLKRATDPTYPRVPTITVDAPATRVAYAALNLRHNRVYRAVVRARATGLPESGSSNEVWFRYRESPPAQPDDVVVAINCGGEAYTGADGVQTASQHPGSSSVLVRASSARKRAVS
jgi:hypothetical protein